MVDVHAWVGTAAEGDEIQEAFEGGAFLCVGVCPQRAVLLAVIDPPEEVVDAPLLAAAGGRRLGVERITLEVEEDVAAIGTR